jgi:hypothetical protein
MASLLKYLKELREDKVKTLTSGSISSIDQYKHIIGALNTIELIEEFIRDKINGIEDIDDISADD